MYFLFVIFKTYVADLPIMHCLNIVRCVIVYLNCLIIMGFQKIFYYKLELPHLKSVYYMSYGYVGQYRNFKILSILASTRKSACYGLDCTVKMLATRGSLQQPLDNQILSVSGFFEFCEASMHNPKFGMIGKQDMIAKEDMVAVRQLQVQRFVELKPYVGHVAIVRSNH